VQAGCNTAPVTHNKMSIIDAIIGTSYIYTFYFPSTVIMVSKQMSRMIIQSFSRTFHSLWNKFPTADAMALTNFGLTSCMINRVYGAIPTFLSPTHEASTKIKRALDNPHIFNPWTRYNPHYYYPHKPPVWFARCRSCEYCLHCIFTYCTLYKYVLLRIENTGI
jgi:hypothetical protein